MISLPLYPPTTKDEQFPGGNEFLEVSYPDLMLKRTPGDKAKWKAESGDHFSYTHGCTEAGEFMLA